MSDEERVAAYLCFSSLKEVAMQLRWRCSSVSFPYCNHYYRIYSGY